MKKLRVSGHRLDRAYFILDVGNLARGHPSNAFAVAAAERI
jgi:hypothetical protein